MSLLTFIKDTRGELKHVSWPSRRQTINSTMLVIALTIIIAVLILIFDQIFSFGLNFYLQ